MRLPLRIYRLRKRLAPSTPERRVLDEVADLLFAAEVARASQRLDDLERAAPPPPADAK